jgi:hypothetical protein
MINAVYTVKMVKKVLFLNNKYILTTHYHE